MATPETLDGLDLHSKLAYCEKKLLYLADKLQLLSTTEEVTLGGERRLLAPCPLRADRPLPTRTPSPSPCPAGKREGEGRPGILDAEGEAEH